MRIAEVHFAPEPPAEVPDVAVVDVDATSLTSIPEWPWSRRRHAEILTKLQEAGARAIAFDIGFSKRLDREGDMAFAHAIKRSGNVVLGALRDEKEHFEGGTIEVGAIPLPEFAAGAASVGGVMISADDDGVLRTAMRTSSIVGTEYPSLWVAATSAALDGKDFPLPGGRFLIDYRRRQPPIPTVAAIRVLQDQYDPSQFKNKIVIVGASARELQDRHTTPLGADFPGVQIVAIATRTMLAERSGVQILRRLGSDGQWLLTILISLLAAYITPRSHTRRIVALASVAIGIAVGSFCLLVSKGVLADPVVPMLVVGAHYVLGLETVRVLFRRRIVQGERSLSTLFSVGETTTQPAGQNSLDLALRLLGDVVDASGVALMRAEDRGELDSDRLTWRRKPGGTVGDLATATRVLNNGQRRVFEGSMPSEMRGENVLPGLAVYEPLNAGETAVGVLVVERESAQPLDDMQLRTIATVGAQLALSIENLRLIDHLRQTFNASIEAVASAVEARDGYTELHCRRLAAFSVRMAERLDLPEEQVEAIRLGALLHDVGKIGVADDILLKVGRLTEQEREQIEEHPDIGHRIIAPITGLTQTTFDIVRHHHERWNGTGYPSRLAGDQIPIGARIVSVVDVWDALSSNRPYKKAMPQDRVRDILEKESGGQFDPSMVELFLDILEDEGEEMLQLVASTSLDTSAEDEGW